jgi:hypothetical protein
MSRKHILEDCRLMGIAQNLRDNRLWAVVEVDRFDRLDACGFDELWQVGGASELDSNAGKVGVGELVSDRPSSTTAAEIMVEPVVRRRKPALEVVAGLELNDVRLWDYC